MDQIWGIFGSPESNGCIERFNRTLEEQVFSLNHFRTLDEAGAAAIARFIDNYKIRLSKTSPYRHVCSLFGKIARLQYAVHRMLTYLLKHTLSPCVLSENLFMTNIDDYRFLMSESGKEAITKLHVEGIEEYLVRGGPQ